jgi:hypothetical protein
MFWVFYLSPYLPYVLSPCHVTQVQHIAAFKFFSARELHAGSSLLSIKILIKGDPIEIPGVFSHFFLPWRCGAAYSE